MIINAYVSRKPFIARYWPNCYGPPVLIIPNSSSFLGRKKKHISLSNGRSILSFFVLGYSLKVVLCPLILLIPVHRTFQLFRSSLYLGEARQLGDEILLQERTLHKLPVIIPISI
jgi:hypothetical protein